MKKINIGILGCANIAKKLVVPNMINSGKYNLVAFASRNLNKAQEFSTLFGGDAIEGYDELINNKNVEAVYIPLPTGLHYEWIIKALRSGKHVFCEKSIGTTFYEVENIIKEARKNNLCVFENFMFPFHSQFEIVKSKLKEGEIGDIRLLRSSFGFPIFDIENNIRYKKELGGGALLDAGAYTLMASQLFLGNSQKVISATLNTMGNEVDFNGSITLESSTGITSQLAFGFDNFYQNNIEIWGSKGKLIIDRAFTAGPDFSPKITVEKHGHKSEFILNSDNHFEKILCKFHDSIITGNRSYQFSQILSQAKLISDSFQYNKTYRNPTES